MGPELGIAAAGGFGGKAADVTSIGTKAPGVASIDAVVSRWRPKGSLWSNAGAGAAPGDEDAPFYHFVYHDGILEGLDDRVKINLMELIRESIADGKIQYMLSAIDSDLPLGDNERKIFFSDEEIILSLHDAGDDGRLFKMPPF